MKQKIKELLKDSYILLMTRIFIIVMIAFALTGFVKGRNLPPEIPLFYSLPRSPDQLAKSVLIYILPLFALIFFFVNFVLAVIIKEKEQLASILLITIGTFISFLLFLAFIKIIFLIT